MTQKPLPVDWTLWLKEQRHIAINLLLGFVSIVGGIGIFFSFLEFLKGTAPNFYYYLLVYLGLIFLFANRRIQDRWRALAFLAATWFFASYSLYAGWLVSGGRVFLLAMIVMATLFLSQRLGFVAAGLSLLTYAAFAIAFERGWLTLMELPNPTTATPIIIEGIGFVLSVGLVIVSQWFFSRALIASSQANKQVQDSQASFHNIVERSSDGIVVLTPQGEILFANQTAERFFSRSRTEWIGEKAEFPLSNEGSVEFSVSDGEYKDRTLEMRMVETEWGGQNAYLAMLRDITERKQMETALREAEEKYHSIVENAIDGIFQSLPNGRFIDVNPAMARMYGFETPAEMIENISDTSKEIYFDASRREELKNLLETHGEIRGFEMLDRRKDGTTFWSSMNVRAVYDEDGKLKHFEGTQEDITNRKLTEENLRQREAILDAVAVSAEFLLKTSDWGSEIDGMLERLGKTIHASHAYLIEHHPGPDGETLGSMRAEWSAPEFPNDMLDPQYQNVPVLEPGLERWYELLDSGQPFIGDQNNATDTELELFRSRSMKAVLDVPIFVNGKWWGVIGFDDVATERLWTNVEVDALKVAANMLGAAIQRQTDEVALQNELNKRKTLIDELETKNEELERFTYTVSHDLKSPLVTISGFLGYLERDASSGDTERLQKDIQRIQDAVKKMQRLLGELLELSRIGRMMNEPQFIPFGELLREARSNVQGRLEGRRIAVQTQPNLPAVFGDKPRLTEVLQNLLDNAAKFMGDQSHPLIEIGSCGEQEGKPVFFVRDNGIGIPPEYHERIFGLFNKLDPQVEGTGVGLALVKRIIEFHGGRIWVESEAGRGSTFNFTLPVRAEHQSGKSK